MCFIFYEVEGNSISYGISQDPDTKAYMIVFQDRYCEGCSQQYAVHKQYKPCKSCQKINFTSWTSENKRVNDFIQEMQLNKSGNIIFEWIPYNQFNCIKKLSKGGFATVYSAKW